MLAGIMVQIGYERAPGSYGDKPPLLVDSPLNCQFNLAAQIRVRVMKIAHINVLAGFSYLSVVIDLYFRRLVACSM